MAKKKPPVSDRIENQIAPSPAPAPSPAIGIQSRTYDADVPSSVLEHTGPWKDVQIPLEYAPSAPASSADAREKALTTLRDIAKKPGAWNSSTRLDAVEALLKHVEMDEDLETTLVELTGPHVETKDRVRAAKLLLGGTQPAPV